MTQVLIHIYIYIRLYIYIYVFICVNKGPGLWIYTRSGQATNYAGNSASRALTA